MKLYAKTTLRYGAKPNEKARAGEVFEVADEDEARELVERGLASVSPNPAAEAVAAGDPPVADFLPMAVEAFRANTAPVGGLHQVAALLGRALVAGRIDADQHAEAVVEIVEAIAEGRLADAKTGSTRRAAAKSTGAAAEAGDGAMPDDNAGAPGGA